MKPILKLLARLYPSAWRNRYGAEYDALLEQNKPHPRDAFDVIRGATTMHLNSRSFVRIILPCALAGTIIAALVSLKIPTLYTSGAVLAMSTDATDGGLGSAEQTATVGSELQDGQIGSLVSEAFDREAMASIITQYNLYPSERAKMPLDDVIGKMRSAILVRSVSTSALDGEISRAEKTPSRNHQAMENSRKYIRSAFAVQFEYADPHVAQQVDAGLLSLLTITNLRLRENSAAASRPQPPETVSVINAPTLPERPNGWSWSERSAGGLLAGLVAGLLAATIAERRRLTAANG
jgi:hypothetical protein